MEKYFEQQLTVQLVADSVKKIFMNIPQQQIRLPIFEDTRYRSENSLAIRFELISSETGSWKKRASYIISSPWQQSFHGECRCTASNFCCVDRCMSTETGAPLEIKCFCFKSWTLVSHIVILCFENKLHEGNDLTPPTPIIITSQNFRVKREKENILRTKRGPIFYLKHNPFPFLPTWVKGHL